MNSKQRPVTHLFGRLRCACIASLFLLTACQSDESIQRAACEAYTKNSLRSPTSYVAADSRLFREKISYADLQRQYFPGERTETDNLKLAIFKSAKNLEISYVVTDYDAKNGFGTPIRAQSGCAFLYVDHNLYDRDNLIDAAESRAKMENVGAQLEALTGRKSNLKPGDAWLPCCIR